MEVGCCASYREQSCCGVIRHSNGYLLIDVSGPRGVGVADGGVGVADGGVREADGGVGVADGGVRVADGGVTKDLGRLETGSFDALLVVWSLGNFRHAMFPACRDKDSAEAKRVR